MESRKGDLEKLENSCRMGGYGMKGRRAWVFAPLGFLFSSFRRQNSHAPLGAVFLVLLSDEKEYLGWVLGPREAVDQRSTLVSVTFVDISIGFFSSCQHVCSLACEHYASDDLT